MLRPSRPSQKWWPDRSPGGECEPDLWGPVVLSTAVGFFVWTTVACLMGSGLAAAAVAAPAAVILFAVGLPRSAHHSADDEPDRRSHGDQRDVHHA